MLEVDNLNLAMLATHLNAYGRLGEDAFERVVQQEISYFGYRPLNYDKVFTEVFDISRCYTVSDLA